MTLMTILAGGTILLQSETSAGGVTAQRARTKKLGRHDAPRRRRAPRTAFLTIDGQEKGLPCVLRDYSQEGAVVTLTGWIGVPDFFALYVEPEGLRHNCRILHRKGNAVRVAFEPVRR